MTDWPSPPRKVSSARQPGQYGCCLPCHGRHRHDIPAHSIPRACVRLATLVAILFYKMALNIEMQIGSKRLRHADLVTLSTEKAAPIGWNTYYFVNTYSPFLSCQAPIRVPLKSSAVIFLFSPAKGFINKNVLSVV